MKPVVIFSAICLAVVAALTADDCVEYVPGNFNMIITSPHGGYIDVPNCPMRRSGCFINGQCVFNSSATCKQDFVNCESVSEQDQYTQEIARMVVQNLTTLLRKTPHLVINKCTRQTLDANRDIDLAAQQCPNAMYAYNKYHNTIRSIYASFTQGKALLFDIHGQGHKQNSTEVGIAINQQDLNAVVASPTHTFPDGSLANCTINALRARLTAGGRATDYDVVTGKLSIGYMLQKEGFAALPGPNLPDPSKPNYSYFVGAFTVRNHSSATLDAIQMEGPSEVRISGGANMRIAYAGALARAIANFYNAYYA